VSQDKTQQILDFLNKSLIGTGWVAEINNEPTVIIVEGDNK